MEAKKLKDLKPGEWFTYKPIEEPTEKQVYIRQHYAREIRKYSVSKWSDINYEAFRKGNTIVYVGFTF